MGGNYKRSSHQLVLSDVTRGRHKVKGVMDDTPAPMKYLFILNYTKNGTNGMKEETAEKTV